MMSAVATVEPPLESSIYQEEVGDFPHVMLHCADCDVNTRLCGWKLHTRTFICMEERARRYFKLMFSVDLLVSLNGV